MEVEQCAEAVNARGAHGAWSLDRRVTRDGEDGGDESTLGATLGEEGHFDGVDRALTLAPLIRARGDRDRLLVQLSFVEELTQREIAARLGMTQTHVSRLLRRALDRLREQLTPP